MPYTPPPVGLLSAQSGVPYDALGADVRAKMQAMQTQAGPQPVAPPTQLETIKFEGQEIGGNLFTLKRRLQMLLDKLTGEGEQETTGGPTPVPQGTIASIMDQQSYHRSQIGECLVIINRLEQII